MDKQAQLRDTASYWAYSAGWGAVRRMPEPAATALFNRLADRSWAARGRRILQLEANLAVVDPAAGPDQLAAMSRESTRRYMRYWQEMFRLPDWTAGQIVDRFTCIDEQNIVDSLAAGGGAVIATAHMGNYDHVAAWAAATGRPLTTVAERVRPEKLYQAFTARRTAMGTGIYPTGTPHVADLLAAEIRDRSRIVALLCDRDMSASGVPVTFFGWPTTLPGGPARLALRTGAPLHTAPGWHTAGQTAVRIDAAIPVPGWAPVGEDAHTRPRYGEAVTYLTQTIADRLADGIREHPCDWHMMAPVWPDARIEPRPGAAPRAQSSPP